MLTTRDSVWKLQSEMLKMPQIEVPTEHYWANGMYARHVWRPKGMTIVGRVHKQEHFCICALGKLMLSDGVTPMLIEAGVVLVSRPGTKRVTYALEDSILITIHRVTSTDLAEAEAEISEEEPEGAFGLGNVLKEGLIK